MNKTRRNELRKVIKSLEEATSELEFIKSEEEDALDNIPENLMESDMYYAIEEAIDELEAAIDDIESAKASLEAL